MVRRGGLKPQKPQEMLSAFDRQPQAVQRTGARPAQSLPFHQRLERYRRVEGAGVQLGVQGDRASPVTGHSGHLPAPSRNDGRAAVLALEFSHLPLPAEHPQRIVDARRKPGLHRGIGCAGFESGPGGEGRHDSLVRAQED